jgi:mono/diheme cytochrome c family protein
LGGLVAVAAWALQVGGHVGADEPAPEPPGAAPPAAAPLAAAFVPSAERGYTWLTTKAYVPSSFSEEDVASLWCVWPEPARSQAEAASPEVRRRLTFARYGLTPRPDDPAKPLQYVVDERGRWSMSCFACHGGQVGEQVLPGLGNAHFALQDLTDDLVASRAARGKPLGLGESMWRALPLGETHGTTNAVMFSVALLAYRDKDLNVVLPKQAPAFRHHDLDAPPWWHVARRKTLYSDGFTPKGHRPLMQFLLTPVNGPSRLKAWENDYRDILAYLEGVKPPRWPYEAPDAALVARGKAVFEASCARCHGTYGTPAPDGTDGAGRTYPERTVPLAELGTDGARLEAILPAQRRLYADSWFTGFDPKGVTIETRGYVAPPLDGIWASAPYLHNGSVPTLWHLLHPEARPKAWRRAPPPAYDVRRGGLAVLEEGAAVPEGLDPWTRRAWFDTSRPGKSAGGHMFPALLTPAQREAVLAYLLTL